MRERIGLLKYLYRSGCIGVIIILTHFGCTPIPESQPFQINPSSNPNRTHIAKRPATQDPNSHLSPGLVNQPTSSLPPQPSKTNPLSRLAGSPTPLQTVAPSEELIYEMMAQISIDRAMTDLRRLTGEEPICIDDECNTVQNRLTGSEDLQWVKNYILEELVSLGYSVEVLNWSRSGWADQNLVARKPGKVEPGEEIYFVAHVDGVKPALAKRFPAADDDGSGVVDLLELARVLSNYPLSRTVVLFFSTGEEEGALGVQAYLDQLSPVELNAINFVVSLDMVGYDANEDGVMELWSGDQVTARVLTQKLSEVINTYQLDLTPRLVSGCT